MEAKHLCLLLLAFVAFSSVRGQNGEDLPIPMENDNQFPPEEQAAPNDGDVLEGSGFGAIPAPEPVDETTTTEQPPIEDILSGSRKLLNESDNFDNKDNTDNDQLSCPENCLCNVEGDDFTTDCSGSELTVWPSNIDSKTTKLKLQNNKLTEIPKEISSLTNLKFLNASNNVIQDLALGSISTLPELQVLELQNNRILQFPMDLKNGFGLTKLETLNLGGNDMRELLTPEVLEKFTSLENIVVPANTLDEQVEAGLCKSLASSLKVICVETCDKVKTCADAPVDIEDDLLDAQIPATIFSDIEEESDPTVNTPEGTGTSNDTSIIVDNETPLEKVSESEAESNKNLETVDEILSRTGLSNDPETVFSDIAPEKANSPVKTGEASAISRFSTLVESGVPNEPANVGKLSIPVEPSESKHKEVKTDESSNYKVGATTSDSKTGGVNKSIIGIIVAGMVVVVAGITIKKNWTSIKKKFSSNSNLRTPDRPAGNTNGTAAPEEVPLQDKSPV